MSDEDNPVYKAKNYFDFCPRDNGKLLEGQSEE